MIKKLIILPNHQKELYSPLDAFLVTADMEIFYTYA